MTKLEYLLAISYYLGKGDFDKDLLSFDLDTIDIEDLTTICGIILDDYYTSEFAYITEFFDDRLGVDYLNTIAKRLGLE